MCRVAFVLTAAFLISGLLAGCGKTKEDGKIEHPATADMTFRVRTAPAEKKTFFNRLQIYMNAEPVSHANICAKVAGVIEVFDVKKGDVVHSGDLLFQTDKFQLEANLEIAQQELRVLESAHQQSLLRIDVAEEQLNKARVDYNRNQTLFEQLVVSQDLFEQFKLAYIEAENVLKLAKADCDHARIKVEQAKNNIRIAERRYQDSIMRAPFDASVVETYYEAWEHAEAAKRVLRLESRQLELTALIPADYYNSIELGTTQARVRCKNTGYDATAPISYKGIYVDPICRTFEIKILLPLDADILSGMLCEADIILGQSDGYGLPNTAFIAQANGAFAVFSSENGTAKKHLVRLGVKDGDLIEIKSENLNPETMQFVIEGQAFLDDNVKIEEMR